MSIMTVLGGILLRNPKVKALIDKGVSDFIDGFVGREPTREEGVEALLKFVEQMKRPGFPDAFKSTVDYFAFLLTVISQAAHLKERPVVLPDLYVPGYHFYFPQPLGNPEVVAGNFTRIENGTGRQVQTTPNKPYRFYAVPAGTEGQPTLTQLDAGAVTPPDGSDEINDWRKAIARAVRLHPDSIIAIDLVGKAAPPPRTIFAAPQDPSGKSDLNVEANSDTRLSIASRLDKFLKTSSF